LGKVCRCSRELPWRKCCVNSLLPNAVYSNVAKVGGQYRFGVLEFTNEQGVSTRMSVRPCHSSRG
jgi:hypothetical protein